MYTGRSHPVACFKVAGDQVAGEAGKVGGETFGTSIDPNDQTATGSRLLPPIQHLDYSTMVIVGPVSAVNSLRSQFGQHVVMGHWVLVWMLP